MCKCTRKVITLPMLKLIGHEIAKSTWQLGTCFFLSFETRILPIDAPNHPALLGDALRPEKKSAKLNLEIIDAANSVRVAYWP